MLPRYLDNCEMRKYCQVLRLVETIGICFLWSAVEKVRAELLIYSVTTFIDFFSALGGFGHILKER